MTTTHRFSTGVVLALALALASAAPASARLFDLNANGTYVAAGAANPTNNGQLRPVVRPNPDQQTLTGATTHPTPATSPSSTVARTSKVSASPPVVRVQAPANGFDWGDAGIGAASALALSIIGLGGALALSRHRTRRTRHNPA